HAMSIRSPGADSSGQETWGFPGRQATFAQDPEPSPIYSFSAAEPYGLPVWEAAPSSDADSDHSSDDELSSEHMDPISVAELTEYLAQFSGYFKRSEGRQSLE